MIIRYVRFHPSGPSWAIAASVFPRNPSTYIPLNYEQPVFDYCGRPRYDGAMTIHLTGTAIRVACCGLRYSNLPRGDAHTADSTQVTCELDMPDYVHIAMQDEPKVGDL